MSSVSKRMIVHREAFAPWMAASTVAIAAYGAVLVKTPTSLNQQIVLTVACCSVVTATQLVIHRARRVEEEAKRDHRTRPASDELDGERTNDLATTDFEGVELPPYAAGMLRYATAVVELLDHAVDVAGARDLDAGELRSGRDDAAALRDLLAAMALEPVHLRKAAKVHTICSLWEATQERLERMAEDLDPEFHRRWRARHLATLRLRHGEAPQRVEITLPYRAMTVEK